VKRRPLVEVGAGRVQNPVAWQEGGTPRSSDEARVMRVKRRGRVALVRLCGQPEFPGGAR
jgi:hypothetical protein